MPAGTDGTGGYRRGACASKSRDGRGLSDRTQGYTARTLFIRGSHFFILCWFERSASQMANPLPILIYWIDFLVASMVSFEEDPSSFFVGRTPNIVRDFFA